MNPPTLDLNTPRWTRRLLALTLVLSLLLIVWSLGPYLWDKYRVVRDTQNYYWMARAQDPTLFPIDYLYISSWLIIQVNILGFHVLLYPVGLGWGLFFYLASTVIDYAWLCRWSILVLGPLCVIYLFKTGQYLRNNLTGTSLSLIFVFFILASPLSLSIASGLQRGFAIPILIVFLYYLIRQQYIGAAILILFSTLVYLPNFPPMVITYALSFLSIERPFKLSLSLSRTKLVPFIGTLLLSGVFVAIAVAARLQLFPSTPTEFPAAAQAVPVFTEGSFQSNGPTPLFISFPFLGRAGIFDTGGDVTNVLVMLIFAFLIYKTVGPQSLRRMPVEIWYLLIAAFIMYALSLFFVLRLSSLMLYLPSRYTRSTLFLIMLFFVGLNWVDFLDTFPGWLWKNRRLLIFFFVSLGVALAAVYILSPNRLILIPTFWFIGLIFSGILVLLGGSSLFWLATRNLSLNSMVRGGILLAIGVIIIYFGTIYINILGIKPTNPSEYERDVYKFAASLPKEAMFAGDPDIMTNLPLFSRRSVLFRGLFPNASAPFLEYFDAKYAESQETILNFCQRYQVDYLVIDTGDLALDYISKGNFFHQPWNDEIVELVAGRSNFILPQIEPIFASGPYRVIKCDVETLLVGNSSK